jgi:hypothetical protein
MAKNLAENLISCARLLKSHPQTLIPGKAICCEKHANLDCTSMSHHQPF